MSHRSACLFVLSLFAFAATPATASADVRLTPFAGVTFIQDSSKTTYGAAITAGGLISIELDAARTHLGSYTEIPAVDLSAHATTIMGNLVLRFPSGPIQPYVSGGGGLVRVTGSLDVPLVGSLASVSAEDFGWNVGGGLYVLVGNIGIRADVRRFQTGDLTWEDISGIDGIDSIPLPKFDFWRATGGITFRF